MRRLLLGCAVLAATLGVYFLVGGPWATAIEYEFAGPTRPVLGAGLLGLWIDTDTADYGAWKFGRRATGLIFSATVFVQKVGLAIGAATIGWMLGYLGFEANAAQAPRVVHGITLLFSLLPGAFALLAGLAIVFYKLDEPQVKQIEEELAARKASAGT